MSGLTNMARSKKDRKRDRAEVTSIEESKFPFGLSISLDDESLKKLGIKKLPAVGDMVSIRAVGSVESVSERSNARSESRNVSIQIEKMDVKKGSAQSAKDAVDEAVKDA